MRAKNPVLRTVLFTLAGCITRLGFAAEAAAVSQTLYPADSQQSFQGPQEYFTGEVRVDMLFPVNDTAHYSGAYVTFAPGARTAWHKHPAGQHMIVTNNNRGQTTVFELILAISPINRGLSPIILQLER